MPRLHLTQTSKATLSRVNRLAYIQGMQEINIPSHGKRIFSVEASLSARCRLIHQFAIKNFGASTCNAARRSVQNIEMYFENQVANGEVSQTPTESSFARDTTAYHFSDNLQSIFNLHLPPPSMSERRLATNIPVLQRHLSFGISNSLSANRENLPFTPLDQILTTPQSPPPCLQRHTKLDIRTTRGLTPTERRSCRSPPQSHRMRVIPRRLSYRKAPSGFGSPAAGASSSLRRSCFNLQSPVLLRSPSGDSLRDQYFPSVNSC